MQALHCSVSACMNRLMQDGDIERMQPLVPIPKCVLRLRWLSHSPWICVTGSLFQEAEAAVASLCSSFTE